MDASRAKVLHTGWVLKKKKKGLEGAHVSLLIYTGYAKRWLDIFEDGTLSYSLNSESPSRGAIEVPHASVTSDIRYSMSN